MARYNEAWISEKTGEIYTPKGRMAWPNLLVAKRIKDKPDSKPKFSATLLIPKAANIDVLKAKLTEAALEKFGKDWAKKKLLYPLLKTIDQEALADYAEAFPYILRCSATEDYPPFIYAPNTHRFEGPSSEIYGGRWAVMVGKFYGYDNVSKGVNFGLNRAQLLDNDDAIAGGRIDTAEGFEAVEVGGTTFNVGAGNKSETSKPSSADKVFNDDEIPF